MLGYAHATSGLCHPTVRALILDLHSEPDNPIPGSDASCLLAGSEVKIVCENIAFPVGTVVFQKDAVDVVLTNSTARCVSHMHIV